MRPIKTVFYVGKEDVHTNSSNDPNRAVAQCVAHMQVNHYGAHAAEVYDHTTGELHAVVKRHVQGIINIVYKRDPLAFEPMRLAATPLLQAKLNRVKK